MNGNRSLPLDFVGHLTGGMMMVKEVVMSKRKKERKAPADAAATVGVDGGLEPGRFSARWKTETDPTPPARRVARRRGARAQGDGGDPGGTASCSWSTGRPTVAEALHLMTNHQVSIVIVLDGDKLVDVFSERDVVRRVVDKGLDPSTPSWRR
jgi:CBS domain